MPGCYAFVRTPVTHTEAHRATNLRPESPCGETSASTRAGRPQTRACGGDPGSPGIAWQSSEHPGRSGYGVPRSVEEGWPAKTDRSRTWISQSGNSQWPFPSGGIPGGWLWGQIVRFAGKAADVHAGRGCFFFLFRNPHDHAGTKAGWKGAVCRRNYESPDVAGSNSRSPNAGHSQQAPPGSKEAGALPARNQTAAGTLN